jgi:intracellular septation protein A
MSLLQQSAPSTSAPSTSTPRPSLPTVLRRLALSLTIACVIPAALFFSCFRAFGVWPAIVVALAWSYGAIAWRAVTGRRTSGLLVLTAVVLTGRTAIALVAHSTFFYFLQPIITDGVVAATFLLSLATARPMVARLAGDFYPMDSELSMRPRLRRLFWRLTAMWAFVCLAKAVTMFWLLNSLSLDTFVLVKSISLPATNMLAVCVTVCAAVVVARREGLLGAGAQQAIQIG